MDTSNTNTSSTMDEKSQDQLGSPSFSWANERPSSTPKITSSDLAVFAALLLLQSLNSFSLFVIYRGYEGWAQTKGVDRAWIILGGVQSVISVLLIGSFFRLVFARWRNRVE